MAEDPGNLVTESNYGRSSDLHAAAAVGVGRDLSPQAWPAIQAGLLLPVFQLHGHPAMVALDAATLNLTPLMVCPNVLCSHRHKAVWNRHFTSDLCLSVPLGPCRKLILAFSCVFYTISVTTGSFAHKCCKTGPDRIAKNWRLTQTVQV